MVALLVGVALGVLGTLISAHEPIQPIHFHQFYGIVESLDGDRLCIRGEGELRCARLRSRPEDRIAPVGQPARGGYAEIPSDSSDPREPPWLWVTEIAEPHEE